MFSRLLYAILQLISDFFCCKVAVFLLFILVKLVALYVKWDMPVEHTSSRPISEVKQLWVQSVLGWVTTKYL